MTVRSDQNRNDSSYFVCLSANLIIIVIIVVVIIVVVIVIVVRIEPRCVSLEKPRLQGYVSPHFDFVALITAFC